MLLDPIFTRGRKNLRSAAFASAAIALALAMPSLSQASGPAPNRFDQRFEINFMKGGMIDHHQMAAEMSAVCLSKQVRPQLKALCASINKSQKEEIQTMQDWLLDWYGIQYAPILSSADQQMLANVSALDGDQFSMMFMENMIIHHWGAVINAGPAVDRSWHDDLDHLAQKIIKSQTAEIKLMQHWLCEWHHVCGFRPHGREIPDPGQ